MINLAESHIRDYDIMAIVNIKSLIAERNNNGGI